MRKINLIEFTKRWNEMQIEYPCWRTGQCAFNALDELYPEYSMEICGSDIDPFYCNSSNDTFVIFWDWLLERSE